MRMPLFSFCPDARREREACRNATRDERATPQPGKMGTALRVAVVPARLLRCSSVTDRFGYAPSSRLAIEPTTPATA